MATKAELQAVLDLDNKPFIRSMSKAVGVAKKGSADIKKPFAGLGAALGRFFVPAAIGLALKGVGTGAMNMAGSIQDSADALGMSTDTFQKYIFAIELAGGTQDDFTKSIGVMIGMLDDAKEAGSKAGEKLAEFGISSGDSPEEAFLKLADYMKNAEGSTESIAKVMDLLGAKLARKVIPALKVGREELLKNGAAASKMEAENIAALDSVSDKMDQYKRRAMNTVGNVLGGAIRKVTGAGKEGTGQNMTPTAVMDEIVVAARKPGFWQHDRPTMTKPTQPNLSPIGPMEDGSAMGGGFGGFAGGYFPTDGALGNSGGLSSGGLSSGGLGGMGSAYGKVRAGDRARNKAAAADAKKAQKVNDPNVAKLVTIFGGTPEAQ